VVSKEMGGIPELPAFVAIPSQGANPTGYLGVEYGPFDTGSSPRPGQPMQIRGLATKGVTMEEIDRRQNLVKRYDTALGMLRRRTRFSAGWMSLARRLTR
jgi:hypothetical protein